MASRRALLLPIAGFIAIGAICMWEIGAQSHLSGYSEEINDAVWSRKQHLDGTRLQTRYTGVPPVDVVLSMLVAVFAPGAVGWDEQLRPLQVYLVAQVFAICSVWTVEAHRACHRGRMIRFNGPVAFVYQLFGSANIMPIYYSFHTWICAGDQFNSPSRTVRPSEANAMLPALFLGYIVPTVAMFLPWNNWAITQAGIILWQGAPFWPNLLVRIFTIGQSKEGGEKKSGVRALNRVYLLAGAFCFSSHIYFLYGCVTSTDPRISVASVLLPGTTLRYRNLTEGLVHIFQWDLWGCFLSTLLWAWIQVTRAQTATGSDATVARVLITGAAIVLLSILVGPGTAVAAMWFWIDNRTAGLSESDTVGKKDKTL